MCIRDRNSDILEKYLIEPDLILNNYDSYEVNHHDYHMIKNGRKIFIKNLPFKGSSIIKLRFNKSLVAIATYNQNILKAQKNLY